MHSTDINVGTRKKRKVEDPTDELLRLAVNRLKQPSDNNNLHLATTWASDLNAMQPQQQILAKKFINDIIFEGQMNTLHRNSVVINQLPAFAPTPSPNSIISDSPSTLYVTTAELPLQHQVPANNSRYERDQPTSVPSNVPEESLGLAGDFFSTYQPL